jgi:alpha-L-fucosidase 2
LQASSFFPFALAARDVSSGRTLWFDTPAEKFTESIALGNGRLGAMLFGDPHRERIVLNESGMWSGSPQEADRPDAHEALPEIRRLLLEGRNLEAEELVNATFTCAGEGSGRGRGANKPYGAYQTLGNLWLEFPDRGEITDYRRELFLDRAIATLHYTQGGIRFEREAFVSKPGEALVLRLTANEPGQISFSLRLDRPERATTRSLGPDTLELSGQLNDGHEGGRGVRFAARALVRLTGGTVRSTDDSLEVKGADSVVLLLAAATDIDSFAGRRVKDPVPAVSADLAAVSGVPFEDLRADHRRDYERLFGRVALELPHTPASLRPTPERIRASSAGANDPALAALLFDYGRYLLISSSRPGGFPANLQGIWAEEIQTPWNGDWHANINVQMNYWPAEITNLSELHEPLFALIGSLVEPGHKTAQAYYNARGWVSFLLANPWGFTSPGESASWGSTVSCSAWLCQHLWDHYLFTGDREFLSRVYPILRDSSLFYLDMLIEDPVSGWLVTAPSNSPENAFLLPGHGDTPVHVCMGPTADQQLLRYLFEATSRAASLQDEDEALRGELDEARSRLAPTRIGRDGRVLEWLEPYAEHDPRHRHIAHLWGLYPGHEIHPRSTPELARAARRTLEVRGDGSTGWSLAYKMTMWARLGDGDHVDLLLRNLLTPAKPRTRDRPWEGGVYPNLFVAHPPFQIDGNFGATAAIAELLLQSSGGPDEESVLDLLPALPTAWAKSGSVAGLRARGGYELTGLEWADGTLLRASIRADRAGLVTVRHGTHLRRLDLAAGESISLDGNLERIEQ